MGDLFSIGVGDTGPPIVEDLLVEAADGTTTALDLTGASNLRFRLYTAAGAVAIDAAGTVVTANPARVSYAWSTPAPSTGGTYGRRWHVQLGDGSTVSIPNEVDTYPVAVTDPAVTPAAGRLTCAAWCAPADVLACGQCAGAAFDADVVDFAVQVASDVLFALSGRQFPGVCPDVIRPVRDDNSGWWYDGFGVGQVQVGLDGSGYGGYFGTSAWWRSRDRVPDRRATPSELRLPAYPVNQVTQVLVDGQVLAPTAYRIADDRWLMRVDGGSWPCCQDLRLPSSAAGTFEVSYTYGVAIPPMGVRAAAALACQVAKACGAGQGGDCLLPARTRQIVRQGLTVNTNDADLFLDNGRSGVPEVDLFLRAVNPHGLQDRAAVMSPDLDWPAHRLR